MSKPRIIAFYLPQYHPTKENDEWWGKGFTEWTNVGKAKPLYRGHQQPKVPTELGYYDLRLPETRQAQAEMAKAAGVEGFCYYHYWFGNGVTLLDRPFNEVVNSETPNFPFCLCWANESWHKKFWNADGESSKKILAEQIYEGKVGSEKHFYALLKAFKDERYIKVDGKLLFAIYKPLAFEHLKEFMDQWNMLAKKEGLKGFYFVGQTYDTPDIDIILSSGIDAVNIIRLWDGFKKQSKLVSKIARRWRMITNRPRIISYKKIWPILVSDREKQENIIPTIIPNWDHTPRSGAGGTVIEDCSPELFRKHVNQAVEIVSGKMAEHQLIFLKSWNEWGEGNYMEPDMIHGRGFIEALSSVVNQE